MADKATVRRVILLVVTSGMFFIGASAGGSLDVRPPEGWTETGPMADAVMLKPPAGSPFRDAAIFNLTLLLSRAVDVPKEDVDSGKVIIDYFLQTGEEDVTEQLLSIRVSDKAPEDPFVVIKYRENWFYIEDTDHNSKMTLSLLSYLFSIQATGDQGLAPVITVSTGN